MKFHISNYDEATREYDNDWQAMDGVLYQLPKRFAGHRSRSNINIKLNIIGKTYNSGIGRLIKSQGGPGSSYTQLGKCFQKNGKKIDRLLNELKGIKEPLTADKVEKIVSIHGRFLKLIRPIIRGKRAPRSFISKYMHFHCSAVPIYDSYASENVCSLVRWKDELEVFDLPKEADNWYGWYVMRFFELYKMIKKQRPEATVKLVDYYLLWMG